MNFRNFFKFMFLIKDIINNTNYIEFLYSTAFNKYLQFPQAGVSPNKVMRTKTLNKDMGPVR